MLYELQQWEIEDVIPCPGDDILNTTRLHVPAELRKVQHMVHSLHKRCTTCLDSVQE